jgi:hypothetical protein
MQKPVADEPPRITESIVPDPPYAPWLALVVEKVRSLQYGVVQIVVHDSHVVQVERTERHRFNVTSRP